MLQTLPVGLWSVIIEDLLSLGHILLKGEGVIPGIELPEHLGAGLVIQKVQNWV
jgi:hypothetical protein